MKTGYSVANMDDYMDDINREMSAMISGLENIIDDSDAGNDSEPDFDEIQGCSGPEDLTYESLNFGINTENKNKTLSKVEAKPETKEPCEDVKKSDTEKMFDELNPAFKETANNKAVIKKTETKKVVKVKAGTEKPKASEEKNNNTVTGKKAENVKKITDEKKGKESDSSPANQKSVKGSEKTGKEKTAANTEAEKKSEASESVERPKKTGTAKKTGKTAPKNDVFEDIDEAKLNNDSKIKYDFPDDEEDFSAKGTLNEDRKTDDNPEVTIEEAVDDNDEGIRMRYFVHDKDDVIIVEEFPSIKDRIHNFFQRDFVRKVSVFFLLLVLCLGVPTLFAYARTAGKDKPETVKTVVSPKLSASENEMFYQAISEEAYASIEGQQTESSRFETLDDLSLYLDGEITSALSSQKQALNKYKYGSISYDEFVSILKENSSTLDTLQHLLLVNKQNYEDEGKMDDFQRLSDNLDAVMVYGDTLRYGKTS